MKRLELQELSADELQVVSGGYCDVDGYVRGGEFGQLCVFPDDPSARRWRDAWDPGSAGWF
jgi:hypothetical protein